jgi:hypothetical protein
LQDVIVPEPKNGEPLLLEIIRPASILCGPVAVLPAIQLHDEHSLAAHKITNEWSNGHLAGELESLKLTVTEMPPQCALGIRRVVPQLLGALGRTRTKLRHLIVMPVWSPTRKRPRASYPQVRLAISRANN